jgi:hypothetical protein
VARRPEGGRVPDFVFADLRTIRESGAPKLSNVAVWQWRRTWKATGFPELRWHDLRSLLGHSSFVMVLRWSACGPANSGELDQDRMEAFLGASASQGASQ